jgi:hypothetical protein
MVPRNHDFDWMWKTPKLLCKLFDLLLAAVICKVTCVDQDVTFWDIVEAFILTMRIRQAHKPYGVLWFFARVLVIDFNFNSLSL